MNRKLLVQLLIPVIMLAAMAQPGHAVNLQAEAFVLLAQASVEPCAICADKERKNAFALLDRAFKAGQELATDAGCRLVKAGAGDEQELSLTCYPPATVMVSLPEGAKPPRLVFRFHTPERHLVGIAPSDLTDPALAAIYRSSPPGTVFEGRVRYIAYQYGDGESFNYYTKTNTVQVHCVIVQLSTVTP